MEKHHILQMVIILIIWIVAVHLSPTFTGTVVLPNVPAIVTTQPGGGYFMNAFIINNASKEKLVIAHTTENSSTGVNVPNRLESAGKWANTSDQITSIQIRKESGAGGGQIQSGSVIKVWGSN